MAIVDKEGMVWIGKAIDIRPIEGADKIVRADIVCGQGGKWGAVIRKEDVDAEMFVVFLPDSVIPDNIPCLSFMEARGWRVKPMKLRGCPSEVLAVPFRQFPKYEGDEQYSAMLWETGLSLSSQVFQVGDDVTKWTGVKKYEKEDGIGDGATKGNFPIYIPKTDELNFQGVPWMREAIVEEWCYISTKYDGSSNTVFVKDGEVRACTRNRELKDPMSMLESKAGDTAPVWFLVDKYGLREKMIALEKGHGSFALQWECVGPKIQKNPLGLSTHDLRLFDVYFIEKGEYGSWGTLQIFAEILGIPVVDSYVTRGAAWTDDELREMASGKYTESGKIREGIVIRPTNPIYVMHRGASHRVSFKVINLEYGG